jgi:hypothetical protein
MSPRVALRVPGITGGEVPMLIRAVLSRIGRPGGWPPGGQCHGAPTPGARTPGGPGGQDVSATRGIARHQPHSPARAISAERSLAAWSERSESPVAGTQEGRTLTQPGGHARTDPAVGPAGRQPASLGRAHTGLVDGHEVIEYTARNQDGGWETRVSRPGELYPADQWASDQQALGSRVLRRRSIVVDWAEVQLHENA